MEQLTNFVSKSFEYNNNRIKEDDGSSLEGDKPDDIDVITDVSSAEAENPVPLVKKSNRQSAAAAKNWLLPDSERHPKVVNTTRVEPRRFFSAYTAPELKPDLDDKVVREHFRVHSESDAECGVINYSKDRPEVGDNDESDSDDESKNVNVEDDEDWSGGAGNGTGGSESRDEEPLHLGREDSKIEDGDLKPSMTLLFL